MARRSTIEDMVALASKRDGRCLSTIYTNAKTPLLWQCSEGHKWQQRPHDIVTGRWCRTCAINSRKGSIEMMQELASKKGGKCISIVYVNSKSKIDWECELGHVWEATPNSVKAGSWCPYCARKSPNRAVSKKYVLTIQDMNQLAADKQGKCLSKTYSNMREKLTWECHLGHVWENAPQNIKKGSWCPICLPKGHNRRLGLKQAQKLALNKEGKCLSSEYKNTVEPLKWQCESGHVWEASMNNVKYGNTWCPYCSGKHNWSIQKLHNYAIGKGGECLAVKYVKQTEPVEWRCRDGHVWKRSPGSMISQNQWCPKCHVYLSEEICRAHFESLFDDKFPNIRPSWLVSSKNRKLELDGYNDKLKIAFEHQGRHHYEISRFSSTKKLLKSRKNYDEIKKKKCEEMGVLLIEIPELDYLLPLTELKEHIKKCLIAGKREIPVDFDLKIVDLSTINNFSQLDKLKKVAESKGGKCLSEAWLGSKKRHVFICGKGHEWKAQAYEIYSAGTWCPICYRANQGQMAIARNGEAKWKRLDDVVKSKGGECITRKWLGANVYHEFKCKEGHVWKAWANSVRRGTWCPQCAKGNR